MACTKVSQWLWQYFSLQSLLQHKTTHGCLKKTNARCDIEWLWWLRNIFRESLPFSQQAKLLEKRLPVILSSIGSLYHYFIIMDASVFRCFINSLFRISIMRNDWNCCLKTVTKILQLSCCNIGVLMLLNKKDSRVIKPNTFGSVWHGFK